MCVFVGYPHGQKGWKLFYLDNKTYFVSRDVNFFENEFPFLSTGNVAARSVEIEIKNAVSEESVVATKDRIPKVRGCRIGAHSRCWNIKRSA